MKGHTGLIWSVEGFGDSGQGIQGGGGIHNKNSVCEIPLI